MENNTFNPFEWMSETPAPHSAPSLFSPAGGFSAPMQTSAEEFEQLVAAIEAAHVDLTDSYDDWFRIGSALAAQFGEGGRAYFHRLSRFYPGYCEDLCDRKFADCLRNPNPQVTLATIFHLARQAGITIRSSAPRQMPVAAPVSDASMPKAKKQKINRLDTVAQFILTNYNGGLDFRNDVLSRKIQVKENETWRDITDRDVNTLAIRISQQCGANITPADVHTVLNSEIVPAVHPLRDWLYMLPEYQPEEGLPSPIETLAAQVKVIGEQSLWIECFRKWFVAMVASWLTDEVVNHQVLVLISEKQGMFKTSWLDHLLPPELRQYQSKLASARELGRDERLRTAEFGLINMDEIDSMTPRELNVLKSVITAADVNERAAYGRVKERRIRCASFCASGNNTKFLSDETGNRRWLPFEVQSIESPWGRVEPYLQIYAEAIFLIKSGFEYWFTQEQTGAMAAHTDEFRALSIEEELLTLYFSPADKDSEGALFLTTSEIHQYINLHGDIQRPISGTKFGSLLKKKGFVRRSVSGGGKGFLVIRHEVDEVKQLHNQQAAEIQKQMRYEAVDQAYHDAVADSCPTAFDTEPELDRQVDTELPF